MKKLIISLLLVFFASNGISQNNLLWKSYASYNEIKDISETPNNLYAASQNALFAKNLSTNTIQTTTTIDGLSGLTITSMYHSSIFNKTLVGYENGLIIVINNADGSMFKAVGILQKQIPGNLKKINHFMEHNGTVYVSCDFGIVQFFLNNSEFGDTYFLGSTISDYQKVYQTTILNNSIYAVTIYNGIKKGDLSNPNLNDFSQWSVFNNSYWTGIATINNQLVAANTDNNLYKFTGNTLAFFDAGSEPTVDFRVYENQLIVTKPSKVTIFNDQLVQTSQIINTAILPINPTFTCATIINNVIYIGTTENGLYASNNNTNFENITPNCPIRNVVFNVKASSSGIWAVYGGYSGDYNPYTYNGFQVNQYGLSKYTNANGWKNIPYSSLLGAKALSRITVNPKNANQVYISSFFSGLLKVENDVPTILYNTTNSGLESLGTNPSYIDIRVNAAAFDKTGNFWLTTGRINNALKKFRADGNWQSVPMAPITSATGGAGGYLDSDCGALAIDKNGTKWMATSKSGVIAYNENGNAYKKINFGAGNGNLPSSDARVVAIDNKNQLWIGTTNGLRVLSSIESFNTATQMNANSIIILDKGLAQELFYEQWITDIVVDGANRKWVATNNSGVFLVSPNGQNTIYHFTTENSPLPSDSVLDLEIDGETGEVFMATIKGMISFKGISTKASDSLENVFVYPHPVRPEYNGTVKVSGLIDKANIKITDIEGNLVYETTSEGGTIEWDTYAFGKYKVASGVYMIFIAAQDGGETKVKKVMIVR